MKDFLEILWENLILRTLLRASVSLANSFTGALCHFVIKLYPLSASWRGLGDKHGIIASYRHLLWIHDGLGDDPEEEELFCRSPAPRAEQEIVNLKLLTSIPVLHQENIQRWKRLRNVPFHCKLLF